MLGSTGATLQGLGTFITALIGAAAAIGGWVGNRKRLKKAEHDRAAAAAQLAHAAQDACDAKHAAEEAARIAADGHVAVMEKIEEVKAEVVTGNEVKLGTLGADNETRRIEDKPRDERTATEQHHLDAAPPQERPQGPGR